jgi:iron complex outermembrane receptor protein
MFKRKYIGLLIATLCSAPSLAQSIEGTIIDKKGNKVVGANVELVGSQRVVKTDYLGRFAFSNTQQGNVELHISASGYAHFNHHLTTTTSDKSMVLLTLLPSAIEVIDITATPFHTSLMESATPVSVLSGEELRQQQASTLGDTLEKQVGVHSNFHAGVASTPIIRGLSGPRVLITQNGLDVSDVSRVGPDHSVASEASTAQQIEVLRGPATLFFGSGAIGGVVNIVDERVPTDSLTQGEITLQKDSVNQKKLAAFNVKSGSEDIGVYADGFWRESDDYNVPKAPGINDDHAKKTDQYTVVNSREQSQGFTLGASYLLDNGYVGLSSGKLTREYGIPGHSHGDVNNTDEANVYADLEQNRYQLLSEFNFDDGFVSTVNIKASYTDYQHAEIEAGVTGTDFSNITKEFRADILHHPLAQWRGGLSLHFKESNMQATGSEAFTPPSTTKMAALALMQERHFDNVLVQLGARVERVTLHADTVRLPHLEAHGHDEEGHEEEAHEETEHSHDEHDHGDHDDHDSSSDDVTRLFAVEHEFTPITLSAGLVWDFTPGYNLGLSVTHSERAPSASELLSFGPHIGTRTYEVGALFSLNHDEHGAGIGLASSDIDLETAHNIDISFRKTQGDVAIIINAFYNQVDNYYYQTATGLFADDGHNHASHDSGHDEHDEHNEAGELPVYLFQTDDVVLHGFEAQFIWQISDQLKTTAFSDFVRARLKTGGDLPRTPPLRFGTSVNYQIQDVNITFDVTRYQKQAKVATLETSTNGYTLVNASISYQLPIANQDISLYLHADNLTNEQARVHSSFVKDIAPRPGRNLALGLRAYF